MNAVLAVIGYLAIVGGVSVVVCLAFVRFVTYVADREAGETFASEFIPEAADVDAAEQRLGLK